MIRGEAMTRKKSKKKAIALERKQEFFRELVPQWEVKKAQKGERGLIVSSRLFSLVFFFQIG